MMKKLLTLCAAVLMAFAVTGSALAAEATTVYIEPSSATYALYQTSAIKARVVFLDAAGQLATTFGGAQIGDSVLELKSANFNSAITFTPGPSVNINNDGYQAFDIDYNEAAITEPGDDVITATLKKGTSTISVTMPVKVVAPAANTYVIRTGLASALVPDVLEAIPNPQNNAGAIISAGTAVEVTAMAAYARDIAPADGTYDTYIFTDNVPAGAEKVNISGAVGSVTIAQSSATLENGIATVSLAAQDLKIPDILETAANAAANATKMNQLMDPLNGVRPTWSATGSMTREVGNYNNFGIVDATADQVEINPNTATVGFAFQDFTFASDTSAHKPAPVKLVTIVGIPLNDETGALNGSIYGAGNFSASDVYNLLVDPKSKPSTFVANGPDGATTMVGAIVGYDQFNNPAPILTSGVLPSFYLNDVSGTPAAFNSVAGWSQTTANPGEILPDAALPYACFIPFTVGDINSLYIDPVASVASPATTFANVDSVAEGVTFDAEDKVNTVNFGGVGVNPIIDITAGDDDITLEVQAEAGLGDSFTIRAKTRLGKNVLINTKDSTTGKETLNIPRDGSTDNAEEDIVFFTRVREQDGPIFLILEGRTAPKTITTIRVPVGIADGIADAGIRPADPGDFPPSAIIATLNTVKAAIDTEHSEIKIFNAEIFPPVPTVIILDAFGNSYLPGYLLAGPPPPIDYDPVTLEDADATFEVVKADGTTPYPGADAEADGNNIILSLDLGSVTADNGDPILKITAGAASAQITYKVRALVQTALKNRFVPVFGIEDTPIAVNFADQNGGFIAPNVGSAFDVDVEAVGGTTSNGDEFTLTLSDVTPKEEFTATVDEADADKIMTITADGGDADAGETTLTLDFNADFEKPVIGALTASDCAISIAITDNKAVNLAGSTVVVKNGATGEDVTSTLERVNTNDGTTAGSIDFKKVPVGTYVLEIVAKDKANNETAPTTRTSAVTVCSGVGPSCISVDPTFGVKGTTFDVVIKAERSTFGPTSAVAFSCTGITVNSATANSATEITANITIADDAADATCDVTVTTGAETVVCAGGFAVKTQLPSCVSVSPASVDAGFTGDVTITLADIDLTGVANIAVSFGCSGITVNSATANSATTVVANITVDEKAAGGTCSVTVTGGATGSTGVICDASKFTVVPKPPCTITISPSTVQTGFIFPRTYAITVTASNCLFDETTTVAVSGQKVEIIGDPVISGNTATVNIRTRPVILGGKGETTLTVTAGGETATATLTVKGLFN
jgi:hypothetical protein